MQNKYLKLLIIALAIVIIIPQVTLAAWWNPFSWGIWNSIFHFQKQGQKDQPQTAGWKTYTNAEYGFEIKYPTSFKTNNLNDKSNPIYLSSESSGYVENSYFSVGVSNNQADLVNCLKKFAGHEDGAYYTDITQTKEINGNKFYVLYDKGPDSAMGGQRGQASSFRIIKNNYCYTLSYEIGWHEVGYVGYVNNGVSDATPEQIKGQKSAIDNQEKILEQISSTFKFTTPVTLIKPVITSISPVSASVGSSISIKGINFDTLAQDMPAGSRIIVYISDLATSSRGLYGVLWQGAYQTSDFGYSTATSTLINAIIPSEVCLHPVSNGISCPTRESARLTPGNYLVGVSVDGRGNSNFIPFTITK